MAKQTKTGKPDVIDEGNEKLSEVFTNAEFYYEQYKNIIIGVVVVLLVGIGGFLGYKNFVSGPKESKAKDAIVYAQKYFDMDSTTLALKGDGTHLGMEAIAKQYSGSAAGNRANFCAGVCNLKLGKYADAAKYLESFKTSDPLLTARKYGCLGDAYAEQNQMDKAIDNYKKAGDAADNETTAPVYLYRAALALEQKGNKKDALELYKRVFKNYPNTQEGNASQIYIGKLEAQTF